MTDDRRSEADRVRSDDLVRWQGSIDSTIGGLATQVAAVVTTSSAQNDRITELQIQIATMKTQIGVWSAVGGLIGSGIIALVVSLVAK